MSDIKDNNKNQIYQENSTTDSITGVHDENQENQDITGVHQNDINNMTELDAVAIQDYKQTEYD